MDRCAICLEPPDGELGTLPCAHAFHYECIALWADTSSSCPLDRSEFREIRVTADGRLVRVKPVLERRQRPHAHDAGHAAAYDVTECRICGAADREDVMLLCDGCEDGYHTDCLGLGSGLGAIPEGEWFCALCESIRSTAREDEERRRNRSRRAPTTTAQGEVIPGPSQPATRPASARTSEQRHRTLRTSAVIRGASSSEIRVLRMVARMRRRGLGRNRRLRSLDSDYSGSDDNDDDDDDDRRSDEREENEDDGDESFDGSDIEVAAGPQRTSERLLAPPPPRPGRRDRLAGKPDKISFEQRRAKKRKPPEEPHGPLPDNRFERPYGVAQPRKSKRRRVAAEGQRKGNENEEDYLWRQLKLARQALGNASADDDMLRKPGPQTGMSSKGAKSKAAAGSVDGLPSHYWISASRHYSPTSSVVPGVSRNHDIPSTRSETPKVNVTDVLGSILGDKQGPSTSFTRFLEERKVGSAAISPSPSRAASSGPSSTASSTSSSFQSIKGQRNITTSNTNDNPKIKERIFKEAVKPHLQPVFDAGRIDRDTFKAIGKTVTHDLFVGMNEDGFDPVRMSAAAAERIARILLTQGI